MSQVKLILRPPPNVDFVHGYPGIPPGGPDRPQAAVKGTVEVRAGPQGAKTKWVRIELRKVETLPGGGTSNTFFDYVGPSPVNLWQSSDEYGVLRSHDFPFSIRIPESIPPSIALDNRAGIQYELVASLCTKGKKGFFRKRKSVVVSTQATVIIDKHELHSTWPIYCQPETRQVIQDGATLIIDRNQTCYGPGDRIAVFALLKSDTLSDTILRGFELTLKEFSRFHSGTQGPKKASMPQERVVSICDTKLAINGALYPGQEHRAELACALSQNHTTTSLNSARHIDVTYVLSVKAIVDRIPPIVMDLPVIISNWQRPVSTEAIRRIGPAPGLSLGPVQSIQQSVTPTEPIRTSPVAATLPLSKDNYSYSPPANNYTSLPAKSGAGSYAPGKVDEFGGYGFSGTAKPGHNHSESISSEDYRPTGPATTSTRNGSANATNPGKRLTVTNLPPETTIYEENNTTQRPTPAAINTDVSTLSGNRKWLTAEDEKQRLYEIARAKVERTQNLVNQAAGRETPPPTQRAPSPPTQIIQPVPTTPTPTPKAWLTAEEEKTRLFEKAQAAVLKKAQAADGGSPDPSLHGRNDSLDGIRGADLSRQASTSKTPPSMKKQTPAELYSEAMAIRNQAMARQQSANASPQKLSPKGKVPHYLTAEQEKAALKRYHDAKEAVDRVQNGGQTDAGSVKSNISPVAYDSLYPNDDKNASSSSPSSIPSAANDLPPPFPPETPANLIPASHFSEKERLRRKYEEQDAAALARQQAQRVAANATPPPFSQTVPVNGANGGVSPNALQEKEMLRRKFEAQDAAAAVIAAPGYVPATPQPPPRSNSVSTNRSPSATARGPRPPPQTPTSPGRILTAAEEKALLKAKYAAQEAYSKKQEQQRQQQQQLYNNDNGVGPSRPTTPAAPPPLLPRPPVEYIQETQEEDARVSRVAMNNSLSVDDTAVDDGAVDNKVSVDGVGRVVELKAPMSDSFSLGLGEGIDPGVSIMGYAIEEIRR
ncbi:hypothetical protein H0H93_014793 [Arthromyces matolae]|nr:hypothetical protein H0H93_014793 [Arthromyces matolae]